MPYLRYPYILDHCDDFMRVTLAAGHPLLLRFKNGHYRVNPSFFASFLVHTGQIRCYPNTNRFDVLKPDGHYASVTAAYAGRYLQTWLRDIEEVISQPFSQRYGQPLIPSDVSHDKLVRILKGIAAVHVY